jgi:hypothetical protein
VKGGAHDLVHHIESGQSSGIDYQKTVSFCEQINFPLPRTVLPGDTISSQSCGQNDCRLVFVDLIIGQIKDVQVVLAQPLEMAEISLTHCVTSAKGWSFELAWTDLGNVMDHFTANSFLQFHFLEHHIAPGLVLPVLSTGSD